MDFFYVQVNKKNPNDKFYEFKTVIKSSAIIFFSTHLYFLAAFLLNNFSVSVSLFLFLLLPTSLSLQFPYQIRRRYPLLDPPPPEI